MKISSSEDELTEKRIEEFKIYNITTLNPLFLVNLKNSFRQKLCIPGYLIHVKMISEPAIPNSDMQLETFWPFISTELKQNKLTKTTTTKKKNMFLNLSFLRCALIILGAKAWMLPESVLVSRMLCGAEPSILKTVEAGTLPAVENLIVRLER